MSIASIKLFCDVAQHGNFSKGAEVNGITQSAASQRIRGLEEDIGVELIDRSTRPCGLTSLGKIYYEGCKEILDRYERLQREVAGSWGPLRGTVNVASIYSADVAHLNDTREGFHKLHPDVKVQIQYLQPQGVQDSVRQGKSDFGILSYPDDRSPDLALIPFRDERMVAVFRPGHRLQGRVRVRPSDLADEPLIGFDANLRISREIRSYLRRHGVQPTMESSFDNIDTIKAAVSETDGVGILPQRTVRVEVARGVLATAELHPALVRPLALVHRRDRAFSPIVDTFMRYLREHDLPASGVPARAPAA
ncbi:MAG: LysR family transcriptional regulator [Gemmatimonadetes bacterium]|nr:LysR family transcriptional regulator [Gemmatimonadota bacterium]